MTDGIVKYKDYNFWTKVDAPIINGLTIKDYIANYLKGKFPNCRIIGQYFEFNRIDLYVVEEKLPVEIQSLPTGHGSPNISRFEQDCRTQIEENIKTLGRCWLFFDGDFLRFLQKDVTKQTSIQLDWLYRFMKEEKLKVSTIDYKGNIKERCLEDFNFISKISTTCELGKDSDERILERNKYDILIKVLDYYNIIQHELEMRDISRRYKDKDVVNKRSKQIRNIFRAMVDINRINNIFDGNIVDYYVGVYLGIFESEGVSGHGNNRIRFVDNSHAAQYFPAYIRNKDRWDKFKGQWLTARQLEEIIKRNFDYDWWKRLYKEYSNNENSNNIDENINGGINYEINDNKKIIKKDDVVYTEQTDIIDSWK